MILHVSIQETFSVFEHLHDSNRVYKQLNYASGLCSRLPIECIYSEWDWSDWVTLVDTLAANRKRMHVDKTTHDIHFT
jgi:hypothetical protein